MSVFDRASFPGSDLPKTEKFNPRSILQTLWEVCRLSGFRSYHGAVLALNEHSGFHWGRHHRFSSEVLRKLFNQATLLKYWHLEAFSRHLGLPTGTLLLFTRMRANQADGLHEENLRIQRLLRRIGNEDLTQELTADRLLSWSDSLKQPIPEDLRLL